jgi:hypothetical protein
LTASEVTVRAKSRLMLSLVKQLAVVIEDIAAYDKEIQRLLRRPLLRLNTPTPNTRPEV